MQSEQNNIPKAGKAYDNGAFMHSPDGRTLRMLSEYLYPEQHFRKRGINKLIVFFGSARVPSEEDYQFKLKILNDKLESSGEDDQENIKTEIRKFLILRENTDIYNDAVRLSEMLTKWSMSLPKQQRFYICTGGGPGMMEAANRGAKKAGAPSVGLNISLPFEQFPNRFISEDLNFEFHYFFMRKFWFVYLSKAVIAMPGGFGTIDEIFELLTLKQTHKVTKPLPIVFYSKKFWKNLINFDYFVERGMISEEDLELFEFADTPGEAYDFITGKLKSIYRIK